MFPSKTDPTMGSSTVDDSLDEVYAMNTALCFLCSINADYREVESYLVRHPEALLFEGTEPQESAQFIVEEQMRICQCFTPECNGNRRKVLAIVNRGFEFFRGQTMEQRIRDKSFDKSNWHHYAQQLRLIERDIREKKMQDMALRSRVIEARIAIRAFQIELHGASKRENSKLALLACHRSSDIFANRSLAEYKLGIATLTMTSLEKEQTLIDQEKMASRRMQIALLKNAFGGCRRHVCQTSKKIL